MSKKWHVHVYYTPSVGEVDLEAADEVDAMSQALAMVKAGQLTCPQVSPTKHMALAFPVEEE